MTSNNLPVAIPIITNDDDNNISTDYEGTLLPNVQGYLVSDQNTNTIQNPISHELPQNLNLAIEPHLHTQFVGTENMALTWRLSKTIIFFSTIDIFFGFLYLFINPIFGLLLIFPFLGYIGAKQYSICKLYTYFFFVILNLALRVYSYSLVNTLGGLLLCLLSITIDIWILRIIYYFINNIKKLSPQELLQIREPQWEPIQTNLVWS